MSWEGEKIYMNSLTLLMVSYRNLRWIVWNIKGIQILNRDKKINYLIIDNDFLIRSYINFIVIKFFRLRFPEIEINIYRNPHNNYQGSQQHASALDFAKQFICSKYCIIVDPDFMLVKQNWISKFLSLLEVERLDLIGFPEARTSQNEYQQNGLGSYKFKTPLPYFIIGKTSELFQFSFQPDATTKFQLDTGYRLANECIKKNLQYRVGNSFSTRNTQCEIIWLQSFNVTYHSMEELGAGIVAVHFGRGSNPLARRKRKRNLVDAANSFLEPIWFRIRMNRTFIN